MFDKIESATNAVRTMNKLMFFGKPLRVSFSRNKSDTMAKLDGDYKVRPKRVAPPVKSSSSVARAPAQVVKKRRSRSKSPVRAMDESSDNKTEEAPNKILFVEELPEACTTAMLGMLFEQYEGYVESRLISGQKGIAFVEFTDAYHAGTAKDTLQGFKITGSNHMKITFARK